MKEPASLTSQMAGVLERTYLESVEPRHKPRPVEHLQLIIRWDFGQQDQVWVVDSCFTKMIQYENAAKLEQKMGPMYMKLASSSTFDRKVYRCFVSMATCILCPETNLSQTYVCMILRDMCIEA